MSDMKPYRCQESATGHNAALVIDSPHSGGMIPEDMNWHGDPRLLLVNEDVGVDTVLADAPLLGIALLTATVSRHYIDLNRALDDLDPQIVRGVSSSRNGHDTGGLVRQLPGRIIQISREEVEQRIAAVWRPYHQCLSRLLQQRHREHGAVWHLNAHSMPAGTRDGKGKAVDIVLGDRNGSSASYEFIAALTELFRREGLKVGYNDPYAGVECVRRHGQPALGYHSVQVEISRHLFYDEERFRFLPQMEGFRVTLNRILQGVVRYTESATRPRALAAE